MKATSPGICAVTEGKVWALDGHGRVPRQHATSRNGLGWRVAWNGRVGERMPNVETHTHPSFVGAVRHKHMEQITSHAPSQMDA